MTALAACGSSNGDDVNTNDLIDQLDDLGGPSVDDTTINHTNGSDTITIGGLTIVDARFETMEFFDDNNIVIPPTWPTLEIEQGDADFTQPEELWPTIGLAVLAQTETVTNDTTRQQLIDDVMRLAQLDDAELVHTSTTTNADTDRDRHPPRHERLDVRGTATVGRSARQCAAHADLPLHVDTAATRRVHGDVADVHRGRHTSTHRAHRDRPATHPGW